jgi:CubicO group peptidase (beta-lactamase class C family)
MENTYHNWNLGYSVHSTAYDLAILAQMILNKGNYDGKKYFSEDTFIKILPIDLKEYYPYIVFSNSWDANQTRGIGTNMQTWEINDKKTGEKRFLLSDNVIGHGSATSSVFRIDLENDIIITQTRRRGKSRFGEHFLKLYKLIDDNLIGEK